MALQLRRGTEAERQALTAPLANGEPLWIPATSQLFIGDGTTPANQLAPVTSHSGGGASTTISDTAPVNPVNGDMWFDSISGRLYVYYLSAWVDTNPSSDQLSGDFKGSVLTVDGLTTVINGSTGAITSPQAFITTTQSGTLTTNGSQAIYNTANPFVQMYATTANTDPKITLNSSTGTLSAPSTTATGNKLGSVAFNGHNGSTYTTSVTVGGVSDGSVANSRIPGKFVVTTTSSNGLSTNTLTFDSTGTLSIPGNLTVNGSISGTVNQSTLAKGVNVYADATDRDASISPGDRFIGMIIMIQDNGSALPKFQGYTGAAWVDLN